MADRQFINGGFCRNHGVTRMHPAKVDGIKINMDFPTVGKSSCSNALLFIKNQPFFVFSIEPSS
jgi:hypothetical protein